uniref:Uncharacterized protein n=1 Tax=Cacopsylla melanoneura TaxID=428564 RepID=A0A8D8YL50_9HEMI
MFLCSRHSSQDNELQPAGSSRMELDSVLWSRRFPRLARQSQHNWQLFPGIDTSDSHPVFVCNRVGVFLREKNPTHPEDTTGKKYPNFEISHHILHHHAASDSLQLGAILQA